jgi:hypothetical protein
MFTEKGTERLRGERQSERAMIVWADWNALASNYLRPTSAKERAAALY